VFFVRTRSFFSLPPPTFSTANIPILLHKLLSVRMQLRYSVTSLANVLKLMYDCVR
jgi:hypothetical protein